MKHFLIGLMLMLPLPVMGAHAESHAESVAQIGQEIREAVAEAREELKDAAEELKGASAAVSVPGVIFQLPAEGMNPDAYPSQRAGIRAAVQRWIGQVALTSKESPKDIHVVTTGRTSADAIRELRNAVQNQLPGARCEVHVAAADAQPMPQVAPNAAWAEFEVGEKLGGTVVLKGTVPVLASIETVYVDKPWADSLADYVNRRPHERWVVGQSQRTCTKPEDAAEDAMRQAADAVAAILGKRLAETRSFAPGVDEAWLAVRIQRELERGGLIKDRFVQRYERPYGTLWREAILVDASESNMDRLAAGVLDALRVRHAAWRNTAVSVAGLLVVIYLLYLFVNAVTKGYFVWRLRTAAIVLAAVGVVMVLWFVTVAPTPRPVRSQGSPAQTMPPAGPEYRMEY
ncbi:MAG TPA: hypothetical protein VHP11_07755 [Tepidisphaeraceae bacterium]|nr:hypothetical protein [Tepidisphaeraceae bacterium]